MIRVTCLHAVLSTALPDQTTEPVSGQTAIGWLGDGWSGVMPRRAAIASRGGTTMKTIMFGNLLLGKYPYILHPWDGGGKCGERAIQEDGGRARRRRGSSHSRMVR